MVQCKVQIGTYEFELACIRHHNKRRMQGFAARFGIKPWGELEPRVRNAYREQMRYAWEGFIEVLP